MPEAAGMGRCGIVMRALPERPGSAAEAQRVGDDEDGRSRHRERRDERRDQARDRERNGRAVAGRGEGEVPAHGPGRAAGGAERHRAEPLAQEHRVGRPARGVRRARRQRGDAGGGERGRAVEPVAHHRRTAALGPPPCPRASSRSAPPPRLRARPSAVDPPGRSRAVSAPPPSARPHRRPRCRASRSEKSEPAQALDGASSAGRSMVATLRSSSISTPPALIEAGRLAAHGLDREAEKILHARPGERDPEPGGVASGFGVEVAGEPERKRGDLFPGRRAAQARRPVVRVVGLAQRPSAGEGRVVLSGGALGEGADADGLRGLGRHLARRGEGASEEVGGEPGAGDPPSGGGSARSTPPGGMSARRGAGSPAETSSVPGAAP